MFLPNIGLTHTPDVQRHVVRHLPGLSVADRCRVEQEARRFEFSERSRLEAEAHVAALDAEIQSYRSALDAEIQLHLAHEDAR